MKTGKVVVTDLLGLGNHVFHSGEPVSEENFPEGNFDKLVQGGFIKEDEPKSKKAAAKTAKTAPTGESGEATKHKLTKADIKANPELTEAGLKAGDEIELSAETWTLDESGNLVKAQ